VTRPQLTPADVEDLRLLREAALDAAGVPVLIEQRLSEPELPDGSPPLHVMHDLHGEGWRIANDPPWLRLCRACGEFGTPKDGVRFSSPMDAGWLTATSLRPSATATTGPDVMAIERCLCCRHCGTAWPGPILQAWTRNFDRQFYVECALACATGIAQFRVSRELLAQARREATKHVWNDLERTLVDRFAHHPMCHVQACAERASCAFLRTGRTILLPFRLIHSNSEFNVCHQHFADLIRDPDIGTSMSRTARPRPASRPPSVAPRPDPTPPGRPDVLGRIDSLLEDWERSPDAYRWRPPDGDHFG